MTLVAGDYIEAQAKQTNHSKASALHSSFKVLLDLAVPSRGINDNGMYFRFI